MKLEPPWRSRSSSAALAAAIAVSAAVAAAALCSSCGLILVPDLSGIEYFPDRENQVIAEGESPSIRFAFAPDRDSVEAIFSVSGVSGRVGGRYHWDGDAVSFVPEPPLVYGRRYVMCFSGSFRDQRGIDYEVDRSMPFFVGSDAEEALCVTETEPANGGVAARSQEIRVEFSRPVDPVSIAGGLSLSPDTRRTLRWEDGNRRLFLCPQEGWQHLSVYTLRLDREIRDATGAPLARAEQVVFLVQEDTEAPTVEAIVPAFNDPPAGFPETGLSLEEGLDCRDAIRVLFSEGMDRTATGDGFSLAPAVSGQVHWLDDRTLVFAPEVGYQAGTSYTILLSDRVCDLCGNSLAGYTPASFAAGARRIAVTTTFLDDGTVIRPGEYTTVAPLTVLLGPAGDCNLLFELAGGSFDTPGEKQGVLEAVTLVGVFPPSGVPAPELIGVSWEGDFRLSMTYAGLRLSTPAQAVYYLLRVRGGAAGVATEEGGMLEEDLEQLLRWEEAAP